MAKAEVSAAEASHGSRLHQAAATILNNTIYSITKHTHQTLEEEQETERTGGGDPLLRENIYPARSTNDVTTTRRAPRAVAYLHPQHDARSLCFKIWSRNNNNNFFHSSGFFLISRGSAATSIRSRVKRPHRLSLKDYKRQGAVQ